MPYANNLRVIICGANVGNFNHLMAFQGHYYQGAIP